MVWRLDHLMTGLVYAARVVFGDLVRYERRSTAGLVAADAYKAQSIGACFGAGYAIPS